MCQADAQGKPKCVCKSGYYGDGVSCVVDPCDATPNPCGPGSLCTSTNGVATCTCVAGKTGDPKVRCCSQMTCRYFFFFFEDFFTDKD